MAECSNLSAKFSQDEFEEIKRIREKYNLSYNEVIRSGVKFYIGLTLAKEVLASTSYAKVIKIRNKKLSDILNSPKYQAKLEQKIIKLVKVLLLELFEIGMDFRERSAPIRKTRPVGRPKRKRKRGRPKDLGVES